MPRQKKSISRQKIIFIKALLEIFEQKCSHEFFSGIDLTSNVSGKLLPPLEDNTHAQYHLQPVLINNLLIQL